MTSTLGFDPWVQARERYLEKPDVTDEEKRLFETASLDTIYEALDLSQKSHEKKSKSRAFVTKLKPFLDTLERYGKALDVYTNAATVVMCPLWGSIRVLLIAACEFEKYYSKLVDMLARIGDVLPALDTYKRLFPNHGRLLEALSTVYLDIIIFCMDAKKVFEQGRKQRGMDRLKFRSFKPLWKSFDEQFGDVVEKFRTHKKNVEREAGLANMIEAKDERNEQRDARTKALVEREEEAREKKEARRRYILRLLATVDQSYKHRQLCSRKHPGTGGWVAKLAQYDEWLQSSGSSCLWCYGIPGSGKTFIANTVIETLLSESAGMGSTLAYFYCDYMESRTLSAPELFGSLARQLLTHIELTKEVEQRVSQIFQDGSRIPDNSEVLDLLVQVIRLLPLVHIVIDGLDECLIGDRPDILSGIRTLTASSVTTVKVFVASRADMDIKEVFEAHLQLQIDTNNIAQDIVQFTKGAVKDKIQSKLDFVDKKLAAEIVNVLSSKAQGMFLWVAFQIADISESSTAAGVRDTLATLPRDLPETYERALQKIRARQSIEIAQKTFKWVAAAKRPLLMDEVKEAVAVRAEDKNLDQDRVPTKDSQILHACANLLILDEDRTVRLAHHTVKEYLISITDGSPLSIFQFSTDRDDLMVGRACLTYLLFNDFERQIVKTESGPAVDLDKLGTTVMQNVVGGGIGRFLVTGWSSLHGMRASRSRSLFNLRGYGERRPPALPLKYRLLAYVVDNWASHTIKLSRSDSDFWTSFETVVLNRKLPFPFKPWEGSTSPGGPAHLQAFQWAVNVGHTPLLELLSEPTRRSTFQECCTIELQDGKLPLVRAAENGYQDAMKILIKETKFKDTQQQHSQLGMAMKAAIRNENLSMLEMAIGEANIDERDETRRTALHYAAHIGNVKIVQLLLDRKASTDAEDSELWTALHFAAEGGHEAVVKLLVDREVSIEAADRKGLRALHLAAYSGHERIVQFLASEKADLKAADEDKHTALHIAAYHGHSATVQFLANREDGGKEQQIDNKWTALHLAAANSQDAVVDVLRGCGVNMDAATERGWTEKSLRGK